MRRCPQCGTEYPNNIAFCGHDGTITIEPPKPGEAVDPRIGQRLGEYLVVAHVADGAMGRVYEGRHVDTKQRVAIKILHDQVARDLVAVERFKREYETARDVGSQHVVKVIDFGDTPDKSHFLTMEFLEGEELGALLRREGAIPTPRALRILAQTAIGLDDAHAFGVIHRDLKPDNIFLVKTPEGDAVRLLDFGSVKLQMETGPKLTAFGTTLGSPYYMSPEQAMGRGDVDNRTDLFALGAIAYEAFVGRIAFDGGNVAEILMKLVNQMPEPASVAKAGIPSSVDDVLEKALAKEKGQRHAGVVEFAEDVAAAFGLEVGKGRAALEAWASKPQSAWDEALQNAKPREAKPFGAPAAAPASAPIAASASAPKKPAAHVPAVSDPPPALRSGPPMAVIAGVGGLALLVVLAVIFALFR